MTLRVDDESVLTTGDDTVLELAADCPHATQAMVDTILARVKGYRYHMFSADDEGDISTLEQTVSRLATRISNTEGSY